MRRRRCTGRGNSPGERDATAVLRSEFAQDAAEYGEGGQDTTTAAWKKGDETPPPPRRRGTRSIGANYGGGSPFRDL